MTERHQHDDSIAAALEQIQRRRELLSRGAVLGPQLRSDGSHASPPAHDVTSTTAGHRGQMLQHAAMGMFSRTDEDNAAHLQQQEHGHRGRDQQQVADTRATLKTPSATSHQRITWVRKPVQRLRPKQGSVEDVGSIEFATMASLASVRRLLDQFYPLPNKREYEFFHPLLRMRVDPSDEVNVFPADFPSIVFTVLPLLHRPRPASPVAAVVTTACRSLHTDQAVPFAAVHTIAAAESIQRSTTAPEKNRKPAPLSVVEHGTAVASQPGAYRDFQFRSCTLSGVRCDVTIREFQAKSLLGVKVYIREGMCVGRTTPIQWFSVERIDQLLKETTRTTAAEGGGENGTCCARYLNTNWTELQSQ